MERLIFNCRAIQDSVIKVHKKESKKGNIACLSTSKKETIGMHMLTVQHRMHPTIRIFPSNMFYDGLLQDSTLCRFKVRENTLNQYQDRAQTFVLMF